MVIMEREDSKNPQRSAKKGKTVSEEDEEDYMELEEEAEEDNDQDDQDEQEDENVEDDDSASGNKKRKISLPPFPSMDKVIVKGTGSLGENVREVVVSNVIHGNLQFDECESLSLAMLGQRIQGTVIQVLKKVLEKAGYKVGVPDRAKTPFAHLSIHPKTSARGSEPMGIFVQTVNICESITSPHIFPMRLKPEASSHAVHSVKRFDFVNFKKGDIDGMIMACVKCSALADLIQGKVDEQMILGFYWFRADELVEMNVFDRPVVKGIWYLQLDVPCPPEYKRTGSMLSEHYIEVRYSGKADVSPKECLCDYSMYSPDFPPVDAPPVYIPPTFTTTTSPPSFPSAGVHAVLPQHASNQAASMTPPPPPPQGSLISPPPPPGTGVVSVIAPVTAPSTAPSTTPVTTTVTTSATTPATASVPINAPSTAAITSSVAGTGTASSTASVPTTSSVTAPINAPSPATSSVTASSTAPSPATASVTAPINAPDTTAVATEPPPGPTGEEKPIAEGGGGTPQVEQKKEPN